MYGLMRILMNRFLFEKVWIAQRGIAFRYRRITIDACRVYGYSFSQFTKSISVRVPF